MEPDAVHTLFRSTKTLNDTYLGTRTSILDVEEHVTIPDAVRLKHVLSTGPTGVGKTQVMIHCAIQDALKGRGFCFINPKGDALDQLIAKLPEDRRNDIIYINPGSDHITPVNVLEPHGTNDMTPTQKEHHREIIVADVLDLFRRQNAGDLGARWGRVLETLLRALIDQNIHHDESNTLLNVYECVIDDTALTALIDATEDQVTRHQLTVLKEDLGSYELEPLKNRLSDFLSPTIRSVIGVEKSGVNFKQALDDQQIILVDIQKGEVGDTVSEIIGSVVLTKVWAAVQARITDPVEDRTPYYVFLDELQNFTGEGASLKTMLAESREFSLGCYLSTQYLQNLESTAMKNAVMNNCRTKIVFDPKGDEDLARIERLLPGLSRDQLANLEDYRAAVHHPSQGHAKQAVIVDTYPPYSTPDVDVDRIKRQQSFPTEEGPTFQFGQAGLGNGANAGGERHTELLQAAKHHFEQGGFPVTLLYQDMGAERPDGHVMLGEDIAHLEAELSTLTKPAKVLRNYHRGALADRQVIFVVEAGSAAKLRNILSDPVNRRGTDHEDDQGTYSYYLDGDGPFTALDELHGDYRIFEVGDADARNLQEYDPDSGMDCPEQLETAAEAQFCLSYDGGFCTQLEAPCVVATDG